MSILMVNRSGLLRTAIALLGMVGFVNNGPSAAVAGETRKVSVERKAADSLTRRCPVRAVCPVIPSQQSRPPSSLHF
jgi:hypothetical protein